MGSGAQRTGRLVAGQRRVAQHAQQGFLAALDHLRQRLAVVGRNVGRGVLLHPRQQLLRQRVGGVVVAHGVVFQLRRDAPPRVEVEVFLDVFLGMAFGGFGDFRRKIAILLFYRESKVVLFVGTKKRQPVAVDAFYQVLRNGVVYQHAKAGFVQAAGELFGRVGRAVIDYAYVHVGFPRVAARRPRTGAPMQRRRILRRLQPLRKYPI